MDVLPNVSVQTETLVLDGNKQKGNNSTVRVFIGFFLLFFCLFVFMNSILGAFWI